jgi:hypothetical protein
VDWNLFGDKVRVAQDRSLDEPDAFERPASPFKERTREISAATNEFVLGFVFVGQAEVVQHRGDECSLGVDVAGRHQASPEEKSSVTVVEQIRRCRSRGKVGGRSGYGCFGDYGDHSSSVVRDGWREHDRRAERSCPQGQVHLRFGHGLSRRAQTQSGKPGL